MSEEDEFAEDAKNDTSTTDLAAISALALKQLRLEAAVANAEALLKDAKAELNKVKLGELPEAMRAAKMSEFKLDNGMTVSVKSDLKVSVPKSRKEDVIKKMVEWGRGAAITNLVSVDLGKGNDNAAKALKAAAEEMGLTAELAQDVATATVKSELRKRMNEGKNDDLSWFGAFEFTEASVK